jgi:hypothetical protein
MGETELRATGGLGTLGCLIDGLSARGGRPALVAFGEEGVESLSYLELAGQVRLLARGLRGVGVERGTTWLSCAGIVRSGSRPVWL